MVAQLRGDFVAAWEAADLAPLVGIVESWSGEYHGALYLRGRYLQATGDLDNAVAYLQRARSAAREAWQPGQQARLQAEIVAAS